MLGTLYVVGTPVGNLGDVSKRALETLSSVELIMAEDTRKTRVLLSSFGIDKATLSYHQRSGDGVKSRILSMLLGGSNLALVTDAGTPGISDPGNELIDFLLVSIPELKIVPIPGASSLSLALSICGFNVGRFMFLGFFPRKKVEGVLNTSGKLPVVFFESPNRIVKTLGVIEKFLGDRRVYVGRELTKMFETSYRGKLSEVVEVLSRGKVKGEIVVVIEGE